MRHRTAPLGGWGKPQFYPDFSFKSKAIVTLEEMVCVGKGGTYQIK